MPGGRAVPGDRAATATRCSVSAATSPTCPRPTEFALNLPARRQPGRAGPRGGDRPAASRRTRWWPRSGCAGTRSPPPGTRWSRWSPTRSTRASVEAVRHRAGRRRRRRGAPTYVMRVRPGAGRADRRRDRRRDRRPRRRRRPRRSSTGTCAAWSSPRPPCPTVLDHLVDGALVITPGDRRRRSCSACSPPRRRRARRTSAGLLLTHRLVPDPRVRPLLDGYAAQRRSSPWTPTRSRPPRRSPGCRATSPRAAPARSPPRSARFERHIDVDGAGQPDRADPVDAGHPADVRVRPGRAGPRRPAAHRAAGGRRRADPAGRRDRAAPRRRRPHAARATRTRSRGRAAALGPRPRGAARASTRPRRRRTSCASASRRRTPRPARTAA